MPSTPKTCSLVMALALGLVTAVGCGGEVDVPTPELATDGCRAITPSIALASASSSDELLVVKLAAIPGCTNRGGQWIVGRGVRENRTFFVGHEGTDPKCRMWGGTPPRGEYGVVRVNQTAAWFTPSETCLSFEGRPIGSDQSTRGVAIFATLEEAESFVATLARK